MKIAICLFGLVDESYSKTLDFIKSLDRRSDRYDIYMHAYICNDDPIKKNFQQSLQQMKIKGKVFNYTTKLAYKRQKVFANLASRDNVRRLMERRTWRLKINYELVIGIQFGTTPEVFPDLHSLNKHKIWVPDFKDFRFVICSPENFSILFSTYSNLPFIRSDFFKHPDFQRYKMLLSIPELMYCQAATVNVHTKICVTENLII